MPGSRAYWKGYLKLSFVSCPVALYAATSANKQVSFRQLNRRTGHRLKHRLVNSITGDAVDSLDKARGYDIGENEFVFVEDRDLAQTRSERPRPGSIPVAEIPNRQSPPTVPARASEIFEKRAPEDRKHKEEEPFEPEESLPAHAEASEHAHDRDRALCPGRTDRCALFREAILHHSARADWHGSVRRHPGRDDPLRAPSVLPAWCFRPASGRS